MCVCVCVCVSMRVCIRIFFGSVGRVLVVYHLFGSGAANCPAAFSGVARRKGASWTRSRTWPWIWRYRHWRCILLLQVLLKTNVLALAYSHEHSTQARNTGARVNSPPFFLQALHEVYANPSLDIWWKPVMSQTYL